MRNLLLSIACVFVSLNYNAQTHTAPTLQIGLDGFNLTKGTLDQELIAEIIAEKQNELKEKLIKSMLLDNLKDAGSTVYGYVDNTVNIIRHTKDPEIRTRAIVENTVNLTLIAAYTRYFKKKYENDPRLVKLSNEINNNYWDNDNVTVSMLTEVVKGLFDMEFVEGNTKAEKKSWKGAFVFDRDDKRTRMNAFLVDLASVVINENPRLTKLGVLNTGYMNGYKYLNKFYGSILHIDDDKISQIDKDSKKQYFSENKIDLYDQLLMKLSKSSNDKDSSLIEDQIDSLIENHSDKINAIRTQKINCFKKCKELEEFDVLPETASEIKALMEDDLKELTSWIGLVAYLDDFNKVNYQDIRNLGKSFLKGDSTIDIAKFMEDYSKDFADGLKSLAKDELSIAALTSNSEHIELIAATDFKLYKEQISIVSSFIKKMSMLQIDNLSHSLLGDLLYELNNDVIPAINELASYNPEMFTLADKTNKLALYTIQLLSKKIEGSKIFKDYFDEPFITILAKLYKFNEAETFEQILKVSTEMASVFKDESIYNALQTVTSLTNRYVKFSKSENDKELMDFDVEGILTDIKNIPYNKYSMCEFHLTVGMNTAIFNNTLVTSSDTLESFSFVSEKIGLKIKIRDSKYINSFNVGQKFTYLGKEYIRKAPPREPVVSNAHILIYGSGLLYNIVNAKTDKAFNYPILGTGIGLTFFNNLDFNVSVASPILSSKAEYAANDKLPLMFNTGFDIQFGEYMQKLNEKRKRKQQQKAVAEILNNQAQVK